MALMLCMILRDGNYNFLVAILLNLMAIPAMRILMISTIGGKPIGSLNVYED